MCTCISRHYPCSGYFLVNLKSQLQYLCRRMCGGVNHASARFSKNSVSNSIHARERTWVSTLQWYFWLHEKNVQERGTSIILERNSTTNPSWNTKKSMESMLKRTLSTVWKYFHFARWKSIHQELRTYFVWNPRLKANRIH